MPGCVGWERRPVLRSWARARPPPRPRRSRPPRTTLGRSSTARSFPRPGSSPRPAAAPRRPAAAGAAGRRSGSRAPRAGAGADRGAAGGGVRRLVSARTARASFAALGRRRCSSSIDPAALPAARAALVRDWRGRPRLQPLPGRLRADCRLNRAGGAARRRRLSGEAVQVALRAAEATGGLVDPTVGRAAPAGRLRPHVLARAPRPERGASVPPPSFAGWRSVEVDSERRAGPPAAGDELDLGATAKALAADRARPLPTRRRVRRARLARRRRRVAGEPPEGGWPIRIADDHAAPLDGAGPVVAVDGGRPRDLRASACDAGRQPEGERHHIVDPRTGAGTALWRTVTVAARSCVDANVGEHRRDPARRPALDWLGQRRLPARLVRGSGRSFRPRARARELAA